MCVSGSERFMLTKNDIDEGIVERVCLPIEYSDPGRILALIRSLFERSNTLLQKKINKYLMSVIKCQYSFLLIQLVRSKIHKVAVLGKKILPIDIVLKEDDKLAQKLANISEPIEVDKADIDDNLLNEMIEYMYDQKSFKVPRDIENCMVYPILHPVSARPIFYVFLVNYEEVIDYKKKFKGLVTECMRYCMGILINSIGYDEEKKAHDRCRTFIDVLRQILVYIGNTSEMLNQISLGVCDLTSGEKCAIYIVDSCGDLSSKIINYGQRLELNKEPHIKIKIKAGEGIAGTVAVTGKLINSKDAQNDPLYLSEQDLQLGTPTRNLLSFPIKYQNQVYGVLEVYNKQDWKYFTEFDEEAVESLGIILGPIMKHSFVHKKYKEHSERVEFSDNFFLPRTVTDQEAKEILDCDEEHYYSKFLDFTFSQLVLPNRHITCLIYRMFLKLGVIKHFEISHHALAKFIITIFKENNDALFFNWRHTFGTLHFASLLVNNLNLVSENYLSLVEVMSLLLAALCHQFGSFEVTTPFQISAGTTLAALYSSPGAIYEKFCCSRVFKLLLRPDCQILENIPVDHFKVILHLIQKLIIGSDMAIHLQNIPIMEERLQVNYDRSKADNRIMFLSLLLSCADMNDYVKQFKHSRDVSELTYYEFFRQGDLSSAQGVFDLSAFEPNLSIIPGLQINFLKNICIPTFKVLRVLFPVTHECLQRAEGNLEKWLKYQEHFEWSRDQENVENDEDQEAKENQTA